MNYKLRFHPKLHEDLLLNYRWYQKKDEDLAREFMALFYSSVQKIRSNPLMYRKINEDYHRFLMRKFPYAIYYYIENNILIITGLFHGAQDPEKISKNLQKRRN